MSPRIAALLRCSLALASVLLTDPATAGPYRLPWAPDTAMELTQDCNDSWYADHIGTGSFAWDFANGTHFGVSAARAGIVTHLKMSSHTGCNTIQCVDEANYVVVDHGDGTASVYLHLDGDSLDPQVSCGQPVAQGQHLANAGSTGWSTGAHLHYQVNPVHPDNDRICECGADGKACATNYAAWSLFWSNKSLPSQPITFDEWSATSCSDRRTALPISQNLEVPAAARLAVVPATSSPPRKATATASPPPTGSASLADSPAAVGGRSTARPPHRGASGKSHPPKHEIRQPSKKAPSSKPRHR